MFIHKFVSTVLVLGMVANTALAATATPVNKARHYVVGPTKFNKVNGILEKAVKDITDGKGSITIGDLRKKLRTHMTADNFAFIDANLAKAPQKARVKFSVKGSELRYSSSYESGWLRVNNNMKKFIETKDRNYSVEQVYKAFKPNGPVTYSAPRSAFEYVSNLLIPRAEAFKLFGLDFSIGGIILGAVAAIAVPMLLDQLGIYDFNKDESRGHWISWWDDCNEDGENATDPDCDVVNSREDADYNNLPGTPGTHVPAN